MKRIPAPHLRRLRNAIPIDEVIVRHLEIPAKRRDGLLRFLCPGCGDFHTATNPRTNLARCFRCRCSYNPIDLVMRVEECSFLEAVRFLESLA
jgi:DNA primase